MVAELFYGLGNPVSHRHKPYKNKNHEFTLFMIRAIRGKNASLSL
jgi:hypothetical protein